MGLFAKAQKAPTYEYHPRTFTSLESFNHDGLELARRRKPRRSLLPVRQVLYFGVTVVAFKIFLFLQMGAASYGAKAEELMAAEGLERLAGYAMQLDPISEWIIDRMRFGW